MLYISIAPSLFLELDDVHDEFDVVYILKIYTNDEEVENNVKYNNNPG